MTGRPTVGIIGAGVVGSALAGALAGAGYQIVGVSSRRWASAERLADRLPVRPLVGSAEMVLERADLVVLAIPDDTIAGVAAGLNWRAGQAVVHCSGVGTSAWLAPAARAGARIGSFHPLQTFATVEGAIDLLAGTTFAIEAGDDLAADLAALADAIGAASIRLRPEDKAAYHLAAVLVSNYLVTLAKLATDLWAGLGVGPVEALRALAPLLRGVVRGLDEVGLPQCLTGPIARGDPGTLELHRRVLLERRPDLLDLYRELGLQTVPIALAKGRIDGHQAEVLRDILENCRSAASST